MRVCGIIAEYDPFHKGHEWQIKQARKDSNADYVVCLMSCYFTQRGMPTLFDAKTRAKMALLSGADVVLGLPFCFSVRDAENFALAGVYIFNELKVVTHISFGCETDNVSYLVSAAELLESPSVTFQTHLHNGIQQGLPFARCQGDALSKCIQAPYGTFISPNNILGLSYLRALIRLKSKIEPVPVKRNSDYHASSLSPIPSATAVRNAILRGDWQNVKKVVPEASYTIMLEAAIAGRIHRPDTMDTVIRYALLNSTTEELACLPDVSEGLENRLLRAAKTANTRNKIVLHAKTKRYTYTRINRAICYALAGVHASDIPQRPTYARVLGFRKNALPLMRELKRTEFSLITKPAYSDDPSFSMDMHTDDIWAMGVGLPFGEGYRNSVLIV